jgi:hypothetical protein
VKVKNAFSPPIVGNQTDRAVARSSLRFIRLQTLAFEATLPQSVFEKIGARTIVLPWRVLRGYGNQLGQQCDHFVLALPQPCQ